MAGPDGRPVVAIVGRPNVGKSTLFNRLVGHRKAITLDTPGVTRDPISENVEWDGRRLRLVDTGGLGGEAEIELAEHVHQHTLRSVADADLVVALFDARAGLGPTDRDTVDLLAKLDVPVLFVANKADGLDQEESVVEFCRLGIDAPLAVSAEHAVGLGTLKMTIVERLAELEEAGALRATTAAGGEASASAATQREGGSEDHGDSDGEADTDTGLDAEAGVEHEGADDAADRPCRVAIVGRPNVGKSSLLNLVAGEPLSLVDARPGTTRDVVDTMVERNGQRYLLLDTAGMRRPSKIDESIEKLSVSRSLEAVRRAELVVLMVEPEEGITDQDARIANYAWDEGKAIVIVMNKTDLLDPRARISTPAALRQETYRRYPTLSVVPVEFMSVKKERGVDECFAAIDRVHRAQCSEVQTSTLNRILDYATERREPPVLSGGRVRFFYATQTAIKPPTFVLFVNRETIPTDYTRFLERCFRENLPLEGSPVRLRYRRRASHGPDRT